MKGLFAVALVGMLMLAVLAPGVSARPVCSTESVSCARAIGLQAEGAARRAAARPMGMATYYAGLAATGPREQAVRNRALAEHYATLPWDCTTMSRARGVAVLYGR
ncbi:MAG: hypothetical protein JXC32_04890 [Anaerolineae bacterium]|nr:hypothetical protein [Anaerolineae bacterium]